MAQFKESYGYAIFEKKSMQRLKTYSIKDIDLSSFKGNFKSGDEFINCVLFNSNFDSLDDLNYFFYDLLIKDGTADKLQLDEDITVKFYCDVKKGNNDSCMHTMPIVFKHDYEDLFCDNSEYSFYNNIRNPLFGLLKLSYKLTSESNDLGIISREDAVSKNISSLYNLYNDFNLLINSKSYTESKGLIETIYRNLLRLKIKNIDYTELYVMFEKLDDRVNRNYQGKATEEQIKIVSDIRKHLVGIYKSNVIDFSVLYKSYYDDHSKVSKDLFNYIDALVKNGPYYYDSFDREVYKSLNNLEKIKYVLNFFTRLNNKGELSNVMIAGQNISIYNHKYLAKMLDIMSSLKSINKEDKLDNGFQRER